jgi:hypothetical protein
VYTLRVPCQGLLISLPTGIAIPERVSHNFDILFVHCYSPEHSLRRTTEPSPRLAKFKPWCSFKTSGSGVAIGGKWRLPSAVRFSQRTLFAQLTIW